MYSAGKRKTEAYQSRESDAGYCHVRTSDFDPLQFAVPAEILQRPVLQFSIAKIDHPQRLGVFHRAHSTAVDFRTRWRN